MDLREICTAALEEISGINVPSSFTHNNNLTSKLCARLATTAGRHYALTYRWNSLLMEYTFSTVPGQAEYDLPEGFHAFSSLSHWDNTNLNMVKGPVSTTLWQALRRGDLIVNGFDKYFFLTTQRSKMSIWPVPLAVETISYWYYTKLWVDVNNDGDGELDRFADDSDKSLIDSDLITADLKWRFRKAKGLDWEAEFAEAGILRDTLLVADTGKDVLDFGTPAARLDGNIAETGLRSMNDMTEFASFMGLMLPHVCPACGAPAEKEHRFHPVGNRPPQFTMEYPCGTVLTRHHVDEVETRVNVSMGCRVMTLKRLTNDA